MKIFDFEIEKIIKSKRKTISLAVLPNGKLELKTPNKISEKQIEEIILRHQRWIVKRQQNLLENMYTPKTFYEGEKLLLLGNEYSLKFVKGLKLPEIRDNFIIIDNEKHDNLHDFFTFWYREFAFKIFKERIDGYSKIMNLQYDSLKISNAKTRWGSCSSKKNINLSWRLIMAPMKIVDYVIIHELAHLKELNHSPKFWAVVEGAMPDYKIYRSWLKKNGHTLSF
ncbi:MAG: M48 family metallopeptidase [Bacteroidales bacterium]|nr:M48 family metallopeptidase [Bacteroidales bacterium]